MDDKKKKLCLIHFTIDTTKYKAWEDKDSMIQHAMENIKKIKKEYSGNCTLEIFIMY